MEDKLDQLVGSELESQNGTGWEITGTRVKNGYPHVHIRDEYEMNSEWVNLEILQERVEDRGWEWV